MAEQLSFDRSVEVFYGGQQRLLNYFSVWPQQGRWRRLLHSLHFQLVFSLVFISLNVLLVLYIGVHVSEMNEVVKGFFLLANFVAAALKVVSVKVNNVILLELFHNQHNDRFRPENPQEQQILAQGCDLSRSVRNFYAVVSLGTVLTMILIQYVVDNSQLAFATFNPFEGRGFSIMYIYQCIAVLHVCILNIAFDSLCCSLFIFVRSQLDILALRMQGIGQNDMLEQLRSCISDYMQIVQLASDIEALIYKPISAQIFCSVLVLTANFYAISQLSGEILAMLKVFIYQICMLTQIFLICYFAGEITQCSFDLPHDLYKSHWIGSDRRNQRLLLMLMQRLSSPIRIRTLNRSHAFDLVLFSAAEQVLLATIEGPRIMTRTELHEITHNFYKYQVWYFNVLGVWQLPKHAARLQCVLHNLRGAVILGLVAIMLLFFAIRVVANIDQLNVILQVFFMFATELSCMCKLLNIRLRKQDHAQLIEDFHADCLHPRSGQEMEILRHGSVRAVKWRNLYACTSLLAASLILVTQWFVDNNALPLSMYEPCDLTSSRCYYGLYSYQVLSLMPTCWLNIAFDSMSGSLLYFLETQLAMLAARLESVGSAVRGPQDDRLIALELRNCCMHYAQIVKLKDLVDGFIKVPGSVQMLCTMLVLVSNFYAISIRTREIAFMIMMASYQFVMLFQIFILCYAADQMSHQSGLLSHALYSSEWTTWNRSNRKMALIMMLRFSEPLHMHTLNHSQCFNSSTFSSIVNCSYSYFALLKRVNS